MFRSASFFIGTYFTVAVFTIFATSNVDSIVGIPHKIYSMQRILIHIKSRSLCWMCPSAPGYAANLVARGRYYHCYWTLLIIINKAMMWFMHRNLLAKCAIYWKFFTHMQCLKFLTSLVIVRSSVRSKCFRLTTTMECGGSNLPNRLKWSQP